MADSHASLNAPVVVASVQTLMRSTRRERWPRDHFGLVVVDEAHHSLADSYLSTLRYFDENAFVLGVTATPDRGDKKNLGRYYQNIAYEVTLLDLIQQNWLVPIRAKTIPLEIDLDDVGTTAGDYNAKDLGHAIEPYLERIADVVAEHRHRKILAFLPLVSLSRDFAALCCERGLRAEHVDGTSEDRRDILARFSRGETRVLTNAMLLTEGYDEPSIDCVVCLRPTKVRALYSQIVGRGTRLYPRQGSPAAARLPVDERGAQPREAGEPHRQRPGGSERHHRGARLRGRSRGSERQSRRRSRGHAAPAAQAERDARRRGRSMRSSSRFRSATWSWPTSCRRWAGMAIRRPASRRRSSASSASIPARITCKGQAGALLDKLFLRRDLGLASARQVLWLRKLGHPTPELATFEEAKQFLDAKWSKPEAAA